MKELPTITTPDKANAYAIGRITPDKKLEYAQMHLSPDETMDFLRKLQDKDARAYLKRNEGRLLQTGPITRSLVLIPIEEQIGHWRKR